jgi:hypothetical protein
LEIWKLAVNGIDLNLQRFSIGCVLVMREDVTGNRLISFLVIGLLVAFLLGCAAPPPPKHLDNICSIFEEKEDWYEEADQSRKRWGVPISVMMAIMHQESKFESDVLPPRTTCCLILPGPRPSSAYGYSQALDMTWETYMAATGNWGADRDEFGDAIDFIGWYCNFSHVRCGIPLGDAYNQYLAYHEGQGGFSRRSYQKKPWLKGVAAKVKRRSGLYAAQLSKCEYRFRSARSCFSWCF